MRRTLAGVTFSRTVARLISATAQHRASEDLDAHEDLRRPGRRRPCSAHVQRACPLMLAFANHLSRTAVSRMFQDNLWIIPSVQCLHILAISVVMGSVLMTNLRILGLAGRSQTMTSTARRFMPWLWWSATIAGLSGVVMIVAEPVRELVNPAFWAKMAVLAVSLAAAALFETTLKRRTAYWERSSIGLYPIRVAATASMMAWIAIVILGRWIAYAQIVSN